MRSKLLEQQARIIGFYNGKPVYSVSGAHPSFTVDQTNFAFYNDGTESGASIIGSVGSDATGLVLDTTYQVRFEITETGGAGADNQTWQLEAQVDGGTFFDVTGSSTNVRATAGSVTDGEDTTQRLGGGGTFIGGDGVDEADGLAGGALNDWVGSEIGEVLFSIQFRSADLTAGSEVINLRLKNMDAYTVADATGTMEALATPTFDLTGFGWFNDGTQAGSTQIGSTDVDASDLSLDTIYQVRFEITETAGGISLNKIFSLEARVDGGSWFNVTGSSTNVRMAPSASLTNTENTTQRLGGGGTFLTPNNGVDEDDGSVGGTDNDWSGSEIGEYLHSITFRSADLSGGEAIDLRPKNLDAYTVADASCTVASGGASIIPQIMYNRHLILNSH